MTLRQRLKRPVLRSFFEIPCRLNGQTPGSFRGSLKLLKCIDLAPAQGEHMEATVDVCIAVEQRGGAISLNKHDSVPWSSRYPDVMT